MAEKRMIPRSKALEAAGPPLKTPKRTFGISRHRTLILALGLVRAP